MLWRRDRGDRPGAHCLFPLHHDARRILISLGVRVPVAGTCVHLDFSKGAGPKQSPLQLWSVLGTVQGDPRQGGAFWRFPGRRWKWAPPLLAPALVACVSYPPRRVVMGLADTCHIGPFARPGGTDRFLERPIQLTLASACVSAVLGRYEHTCHCSGAAHWRRRRPSNVQSLSLFNEPNTLSLMVTARHSSVSVVMAAEGRGIRDKVGGSLGLRTNNTHSAGQGASTMSCSRDATM
ncbi:hypothetical protein GGI42DRAFT_154242 [Trichoderma sp. SZMC 28013]